MYQSQRTNDTGQPVYNPYSGHYPNQYPSNNQAVPNTFTQANTYYPPFPPIPQSQVSPAVENPPTPPEPAVSSQVALHALERLVLSELRQIGFEKAEQTVVRRFQLEVAAFVQQLFERAHEYANLANRAGPVAPDLLLVCEEFDLPQKELQAIWRRNLKKRQRSNSITTKPIILVPPASRSPSPDLLPSDDEGAPIMIPVTLRSLPSYFPSLPPKHTYLRTPASPPKKAALPSLEKKLKTAGLVQESLRNLLLATEDNSNQEDAELLGHIVNWETSIHPRKRWKVGPNNMS